jgi:O-antigen/teichoic acid export membrane protein
VALSLTMLPGLFLIVLGPRFLARWIDASFEQPAGPVLQILMVSSLVFLPIRGVALPILMGLGKPKVPTIAFLIAGILNLAMSVILARPLGLTGVALGTAVPNVLFALVVLVLACRELGISVRHYTQYVVPRAVIGALPVLALLQWFKGGRDRALRLHLDLLRLPRRSLHRRPDPSPPAAPMGEPGVSQTGGLP